MCLCLCLCLCMVHSRIRSNNSSSRHFLYHGTLRRLKSSSTCSFLILFPSLHSSSSFSFSSSHSLLQFYPQSINILCIQIVIQQRGRAKEREMEKLEPSINKQLVGMVQVGISTVIVLYKYLRSMFCCRLL